jgi:diketogulonate reductase-like aldo/keto reductase
VPQVPTVTLHDHVVMPRLGFGVFLVRDNDDAARAVACALETGYRAIDTAAYYRNERGVGRAVAESGLRREDVFLTTKVWNADNGYDSTLRAFDLSLKRLDMDYVDLYLIHWPDPAREAYVDTWRALERLWSEGRTRAIGVSNFNAHRLDELRDKCGVIPSINQIELHPWLTQRALRAYHRDHGIVTQSWSPLGHGKLLDEPALAEIAAAHGKTAAQVIIRWNLQSGIVVIPKSVTPSRIAENFDVLDFELSEQDMNRIEALNTDTRTGPDPEARWIGPVKPTPS